MDIVRNFIVTILLLQFEPVTSCKAVVPDNGINPATQVQTTTGTNNSLHSEALYHSVKAIATFNLSGHVGSLITFSIVLLLIAAVYKKLSDFLRLVNDRLHNFAALFGIHGFAHDQPAIELENKQ